MKNARCAAQGVTIVRMDPVMSASATSMAPSASHTIMQANSFLIPTSQTTASPYSTSLWMR